MVCRTTSDQRHTPRKQGVVKTLTHLISKGLQSLAPLLLGLSTLGFAPPSQPTAGASGYREDRILIQPKSAATQDSLARFHRTKGSRRVRHFQRLSGIEVIEVPRGTQVHQLVDAYRRSGLVEVVEPDYFVESTAAPTDPNFRNGALWYLNQLDGQGNWRGPDIQAPLAWDTKTNADDIVVALIDTGARLTHEDLTANLWINPAEVAGNGIDDDGNGVVDDVHGIDTANQTGNPFDVTGHGTRVAGVLGGVGNNGLGGVGVAWRVKMMICRYASDNGQGTFSDILECFDYARAKGARIINASFGSTNTSALLLSAVNACRSAGIIVVAGAGNNGINNDTTPFYPASYTLDNIVSVAATTRSDELAGYSNFGAKSVDLAAPGTDILSAGAGSDTQYLFDSGTSYSTAIASGSLALLWARFPNESYTQIIQRLLSSVDPLPGLSNKCVTGGRLNLAKALGPSLVADFNVAQSAAATPLIQVFSDNSYGNIVARQWDFGDNGSSTEASPTHLFPAFGDYLVRLTLTNSLGKTAQIQKVVAVSPAYAPSAAAYVWLTPSSRTVLSLSNDGVSAAQTIPFPFVYYGTTRTQLFVGANGLLGFTATGVSQAANTDLPNPAAPNDFLSPFWSDLVPSANTTISVGIAGSSPNRNLVVTWSRISLPAPQTATVNFQVVLNESTGQILFNYQEVAASSRNANAAGKRATIGLEGPQGTAASRFSYLGSVPLTNSQSIRWTPPTSWPRPAEPQVIPSAVLASSGKQGGPFTPSGQFLVLTNSGGSASSWEAESTVDWLTVYPLCGTLLPQQGIRLDLTLTSEAPLLVPGGYRGEIRINGGSLTLRYELSVYGIIQLLSPSPVTSGSFSFQMHGDPVSRYVLEATTNFQTWIPVSTNQTDVTGTLTFSHPVTGEFPFRFFRATRLDSTTAP
ncbi:MAG: S8 family serine peptidase [Verrucomicrobiales bacterium]|nr:S8 family serine peptidase [Verrucomicrobiales bacterium]